MSEFSLEKNGFGRIGRIPTPTGFPVGDMNAYCVLPSDDCDQLILIDTGVKTRSSWAALNEGLAAFGYAVEDISRVILTHAHPDHFGQAARIKSAAGCEVWSHELAFKTMDRYTLEPDPERIAILNFHMRRWGVPQELLEGEQTWRHRSAKVVERLTPDRLLKCGDIVEIPGFNLEVVHTPGHCPEEVVFWQADSKIMFSGDHLLPDITPACLINIPETREAARESSLLVYLESLIKAEQLPATRVYPSHGDPIDDHRALIASYRRHIDRRSKKIRSLLAKGAKDPFSLGRGLFGRVAEEQFFLVISEIMGHVDLLEERGLIDLSERAGVMQVRLTGGAGEVETPAAAADSLATH